MHDAAHSDRHRDEQHQREDVLRGVDCPGVHWRREIPVQQQAAGDRRHYSRQEAAQQCHAHHGRQIDQQVVRKDKMGSHGRQTQGEDGKTDRLKNERAEESAAADA